MTIFDMDYSKTTIIFVAIFFATAYAEKYTTKWDNINVSEILDSDRLLSNYYKCLNDEGRCTPEGSELKRHLPDALITECSKCSEKQKENTEKVIDFLIAKKKEMWTVLQEKYDPEHNYYNKHYSSTSTPDT